MRKMEDHQMEVLIRVTQQFHGLRRYLCFCEGLPPGEFFMLATIKRFLCGKKREGQQVPGIAVSELAGELEITNPAASKMLRSVEEKGYIQRRPDPSDRRVTYITLSEAGEAILEQAKTHMDEVSSRLIARMGKEDTEELTRLLNKLFLLMEQELKEAKKGSV